MAELTREQKIQESLNREIEKKTKNISSTKMNQMREQYAQNMQQTILQTDALTATGLYNFKNKNLAEAEGAFTSERFQKVQDRQQELTHDRALQESHKGKESDQEKAAVQRGTYQEYFYDSMSATNVHNLYLQKKSQIDSGEAQAVAHKCTGKEFLLPPMENMVGEPIEQIANVMLEKDRLKGELSRRDTENTPYSKAKRKVQKQFLTIMEDMISTYFKSNGMDIEKGGTVKKKEIDAAKKHMALALEKYEMFARRFDEHVAEAAMSSLKKSTAYTEKKREKEAAPINAAELEELKTLISSNPDKYDANKDIINKVLVHYQSLCKKMDKLDTENKAFVAGVDAQVFAGGQHADEIEAVKRAYSARRDGDIAMLNQGAKACVAYIKHIISGQNVLFMDDMYIKQNFGKNATIDAGNGVTLQMNKPIFEVMYKKEIEADPMNAGSPHKLLTKIARAEHVYNGDEMAKAQSIYEGKSAVELTIDSHLTCGVRDMGKQLVPVLGKVDVTDEQIKEFGANQWMILTGTHAVGRTPATDEEQMQAFRDSMPYYRKVHEELIKYKEMFPELSDTRDDYSFLFKYKNFEPGMFTTISSKAQTMCYSMTNIVKNKVIAKNISDEEVNELIKMWDFSGAMQRVFGNVMHYYDEIVRMTPYQLIGNGYDEWSKYGTFDFQLQDVRTRHVKEWEDARKQANS